MLIKKHIFPLMNRLPNGALSNPCSILKTALQYNKYIVNGERIDEIGAVARPIQQGGAYVFNGTGNYIDTGIQVQGQMPIGFEISVNISNMSGNKIIFAAGCQTSTSKGIVLRALSSTGQLQILVSDGTNYTGIINTGVTLSVLTDYIIAFEWAGLAIDDSILTINGSATTHNLGAEWTGVSNNNFKVGWLASTQYLTGSISYYAYTINGNDKVESYCEQTEIYNTNQLFTKTTGVTHTLVGVQAGFFGTDKLAYSDANAIGYGVLNSQPDLVVPLDGETNLPVIASDINYTGRAKYNQKIDGYPCMHWNITDNQLDLGVAGLTITEFSAQDGTTPIIDGQFLKVDVGGWVANVKLSDGRWLPFVQGSGREVVEVISGIKYQVDGVLPTWDTQSVYDYKGKYGFSIDGLAIIPASQTNPTLDTEGNILTNPAVLDEIGRQVGFNDPNITVEQPSAYDLINADVDNLYFDALGNAKKVPFEELDQNTGDYDFNHIVDAEKDKRSHLLFSEPQSQEVINKIYTCYAKTSGCLLLSLSFCSELNSQYLPLIF